MTRLNSEELNEKYVGARIKYIKGGHRNGWEGFINEITLSRVQIRYDNCLDQWYRLDALIQREDASYDDAYLRVIDFGHDSSSKPTNPPKINKYHSYLAVDAANGVTEGFSDEETATAFALEQVVSGKGFTKVQVYKGVFTVQTKTPEHEVIALSSTGKTL
jgi:hypothetical protein